MRRFVKGSIESGFAYLFVGGESDAMAEKRAKMIKLILTKPVSFKAKSCISKISC